MLDCRLLWDHTLNHRSPVYHMVGGLISLVALVKTCKILSKGLASSIYTLETHWSPTMLSIDHPQGRDITIV